jgi:hypothetical protein
MGYTRDFKASSIVSAVAATGGGGVATAIDTTASVASGVGAGGVAFGGSAAREAAATMAKAGIAATDATAGVGA